jgi:hypothetical protein
MKDVLLKKVNKTTHRVVTKEREKKEKQRRYIESLHTKEKRL